MRTLMYHDIAPSASRDEVGFPGPLAARYKLEPEAFEAHLDALAQTRLRVGTLATASGPPPQLSLSFDDGGSSALLAAQALERRGWRGQFFITTGCLGTPGFLAAEDLHDLARRGHAIGAHSHTHPTYMGRLTREGLDREWRLSRDVLEDILGAPPRSASVPGGHLSHAVIVAAAAAGYELLFTSEPTARVGRLGKMAIRGRYTIWSTTPARVAVAYSRGRRIACARLWLEWNAKKLAKNVSPSAYQALRRVRAGGVRTGHS